MNAMNPVNRITRKRTAGKPRTRKPTPATVEPQTAEPGTPFVPDDAMLVAHGMEPRFFKTSEEAREAACDFAEEHPGQWVEVYGRQTGQPGWVLWELVGVSCIDSVFDGAASWITVVETSQDNIIH